MDLLLFLYIQPPPLTAKKFGGIAVQLGEVPSHGFGELTNQGSKTAQY
ncbi:MAG: hypothetical protein ABW158_11850 [Candidatus Thiodiazotropha sp. 6PDIVS]